MDCAGMQQDSATNSKSQKLMGDLHNILVPK